MKAKPNPGLEKLVLGMASVALAIVLPGPVLIAWLLPGVPPVGPWG